MEPIIIFFVISFIIIVPKNVKPKIEKFMKSNNRTLMSIRKATFTEHITYLGLRKDNSTCYVVEYIGTNGVERQCLVRRSVFGGFHIIRELN